MNLQQVSEDDLCDNVSSHNVQMNSQIQDELQQPPHIGLPHLADGYVPVALQFRTVLYWV